MRLAGFMLRSDQPFSGGPRLFGYFPAREHTRDLLAPAAPIERFRAGFHGDVLAFSARGFVEPVMSIRMGCHLGGMGDSEHLSLPAEPHKTLSDCRSGRSANTGVDFIENENGSGALLREYNFKREKEAGQLSARCHLHQ